MAIKKLLKAEKSLSLGKTITLNVDESSSTIASYFLRAHRGRTELSEILLNTDANNDFISRLEKIRLALRKNQVDIAAELIQMTKAEDELEQNELQLEHVRLMILQKKYDDALLCSEKILASPLLAFTSKMTLHQIRGLSFIYLQNYEKAIDELKLAITLSALFPEASSGFLAHTVLAQAYSYLGDQKQAIETLTIISQHLDQVQDMDQWIEKKVQHLRAQFHFSKNFSSANEARSFLVEAKELAEWQNLNTTVELCKSDLNDYTTESPTKVVHHFLGWKYFPRLQLILWNHPKKSFRIKDSEQSVQILNALTMSDKSQEALFQEIWGLELQERYEGHLRATFSKIRSKLPVGALTVKNGIVKLS
jgi:tetratricopeptide (TPR) repeat protein